MRRQDIRQQLDAAWQAFERAQAHDDPALRLASLRVIDALLRQLPPDGAPPSWAELATY